MRYIKIYDSFNMAYSEITEEEFDEMVYYKDYETDFHMDRKTFFFTKEEEDIISEFVEIKNGGSETDYINFLVGPLSLNASRIYAESNCMQLTIFKLKDEWYVIHDEFGQILDADSLYLKCDQIHGLIECLKSINTIVNNKYQDDKIVESNRYYEITEDEFEDTLSDDAGGYRHIDFSRREADYIVKIIKNLGAKFKNDHLDTRLEFIEFTIPYGKYYCDYTIYKLEDEWYFISDEYNDYYKCDQLDGLISCLKKIFKKY